MPDRFRNPRLKWSLFTIDPEGVPLYAGTLRVVRMGRMAVGDSGYKYEESKGADMRKMGKLFALSFALGVFMAAGTSSTFAAHRPGHAESPPCDPHPTKPGADQNKHCVTEPAPPPPAPQPVPPPPAPVSPAAVGPPGPPGPPGPAGPAGGRGGPAPAPPAAAVSGELPFTGVEIPQALFAAGALVTLGGTSLALGRRRGSRARR